MLQYRYILRSVIFLTLFPRCGQKVHDDVIKWKRFPSYWPFVRGIHRSPVKGQWRGALMFSLICVWINGWVNNREAGDYDVIVMQREIIKLPSAFRTSSVHHCASDEPLRILPSYQWLYLPEAYHRCGTYDNHYILQQRKCLLTHSPW